MTEFPSISGDYSANLSAVRRNVKSLREWFAFFFIQIPRGVPQFEPSLAAWFLVFVDSDTYWESSHFKRSIPNASIHSSVMRFRCLEIPFSSMQYIHNTLPETNSSPLKIGHTKRKLSSSNHPFSGAMCARVDQLPLFPYNRGWENQPNHFREGKNPHHLHLHYLVR